MGSWDAVDDTEKETPEREKKIQSLAELAAPVAANYLCEQGPDIYASKLFESIQCVSEQIIAHTPVSRVTELFALHNTYRKNYGITESTPINLKRLIYALSETENSIDSLGLAFESSWNPIDVWKDRDTFLFEPESEEENKIGKFSFAPSPPIRQSGAFSVCDHETFTKRFSEISEGIFEGWKEWESTLIMGEIVLACLLPEFHVPKSKICINIYVYGPGESMLEKVERLCTFLESKNCLMIKSKDKNGPLGTIVFQNSIGKKLIQIEYGYTLPKGKDVHPYEHLSRVLLLPDIDAARVAYDGTRVFATPAARFSLNFRCLVTNQKRFLKGISQHSVNYERSLIKYSKKYGFYIWDMFLAPDFSNIELQTLKSGLEAIS